LRILETDSIAGGILEEVAFFDTIPGSNSAQFSGTWSSYIYFESGNIILSDIGNGLFVVAPDWDAINGTPPPPPGDCFYQSNFESNSDGWTTGNNSCSTGSFVQGSPTQTTSGGTILQVAGAAQGNGAWFTAPNSALGTNDVDGGTCETLSPLVNASSASNAEVSLSYFFGQRDAGDDANDGFSIEILNNGSVVDTLVSTGDVQSSAAWTDVSTTIANPGSIQVRVRASDGSGPGDIVEAGIDQVLICPKDVTNPPPTCTVEEGFESGTGGWSNSSASSCSTGSYVSGTPSQQSNGGVTTQVGGANSGSNAYFTATNTSAGANDVDGGNCIASSPNYNVTSNSTLSIAYFHGQRDAGDDASDFFNLELSTDGGNNFTSIASAGDARVNAAWATANAQIPAGSDVVLRVQCSDGAGPGDLVECGIDDVNICPN